MRIIANRLGVTLEALSMAVTGRVDVRGTLRVSNDCPVGFACFDIHVDVQTGAEVDGNLVRQMLKAAEYSCVVLQTLRGQPAFDLTAAVNEVEAERLAS